MDALFDFLSRHSSLILTTHDPADADGIGAEKAFAQIARAKGKQVRIINSGPIPETFRFIDRENIIEIWGNVKEALSRDAGLIILDTADEYNIGELRDIIPYVTEVFVIDHHDPNQFSSFRGIMDNTAASTCELIIELALSLGISLSPENARAAYAGMVYDTGFFAYAKTTKRTFKAALALMESGVKPYEVYREMNENSTTSALLLQKSVLSSLKIHNNGRVAVQILRKEDLEKTGALFEDAEHFINIPLKSMDIDVSILVKENKEGHVRCSLRSKGTVNVSKIAQSLGGGGHVTAAGFRSSHGWDKTLKVILERVSEELNKT
jgi:phosphoesterase RecJ-like protein